MGKLHDLSWDRVFGQATGQILGQIECQLKPSVREQFRRAQNRVRVVPAREPGNWARLKLLNTEKGQYYG